MAKTIIVTLGGSESSFAISKLDRAKLYPTRKRLPMDRQGAICTRASMTSDGKNILRSGMTAQGYFAASGRWVAKEEFVGLNPDGSVATLMASTLGVPQSLEGPVSARDLLDLEVIGVYLLEPESISPDLLESLRRGDLYRFPFNYGADYNCETAYLVSNDEGLFALVGNPTEPSWVEAATVFVAEPEEESADELDFEMM